MPGNKQKSPARESPVHTDQPAVKAPSPAPAEQAAPSPVGSDWSQTEETVFFPVGEEELKLFQARKDAEEAQKATEEAAAKIAALEAELARLKSQTETKVPTAKELREKAIALDKETLEKVMTEIKEKQAKLDAKKKEVENAERTVDALRVEFDAVKEEMENLQKEKNRLNQEINKTIPVASGASAHNQKQTTAADLAKKPAQLAKNLEPTPSESKGKKQQKLSEFERLVVEAILQKSHDKKGGKLKNSHEEIIAAFWRIVQYFEGEYNLVQEVIADTDSATFNTYNTEITKQFVAKEDPQQQMYFCTVKFLVTMMKGYVNKGDNWNPAEYYGIKDETHITLLKERMANLTGY